MFITFEGIEGCGKSTQARRLVKHLEDQGVDLVFTLEPGGTPVGQAIRHILLDPENRHMSPLAELLLYAADRAQHMEEIIRPALAKRIWVVCDRFFDATIVYQGYVRGQDMDLIRTLNREACGGMEPDMTFLLDCPVEIGLERARARNRRLSQEGQDRFEREKRQFHESVRAGYLSLAARHPDRFVVLDATLMEAKLEAEIVDHIRPFLWKQGKHG